MFVNFEEMPDNARVWIYQLERELTNKEAEFVSVNTRNFLDNWAAHNNPLKGSFKFFHNQFLVLAVDESVHSASGCSIDSSVHLTQQLSKELNVAFSTNNQVAFMQNEEVKLVPFTQIKQKVDAEEIIPETLVFNNTIQNYGQLTSEWLVESKNSWVKRYFP